MPCTRCGEAGGFHGAVCHTYNVQDPLVYQKNEAGEWRNSLGEPLPGKVE